MKIIETEKDIACGVRALKRKCPRMKQALKTIDMPPLRRRVGGFEGLARIVVGQLLSVASADAIWGRVYKAVQPFQPDVFLRKREATLRKCGLSASKYHTLKGIAQAFHSGALSEPFLRENEVDVVRSSLIDLKGIGPWTADIYCMFCLGHADAWAPGDLALQVGAGWLLERDEKLSEAEMVDTAEAWRPWRAVAARALWSYYANVKAGQRSGEVREAIPL